MDAQATVWTGGADGYDWQDAGNWSNGIPVAGQDAIIGSAVSEPVLLYYNFPSDAFARDVELSSGAELRITVIGNLTAESLKIGRITSGSVWVEHHEARITLDNGASADLEIGSMNGTGTMTIGGGAIVSTGTGTPKKVVLGAGTNGGTGTLTLEDNGFLITNAIGVGTNATAVLDFSGGTLRANQSRTDFLAADAGLDVTISSSGRIDTNGFDVGISASIGGSGMLYKRGEGTLTLTGANTYAGGTVHQRGTLVLDGAGSSISHEASILRVGFTINDDARMEIRNGADATSSFGEVGNGQDAKGYVLVTGNGSTWTNHEALYVGLGATGELTIENGGSVYSTGASLGGFAEGNGKALITGANSNWTNELWLVIGDAGVGELTVADGGRVSVTVGEIKLGAGSPTASGTLNVGNGGAAGIVNASAIHGSHPGGQATLNFNHTDADYYFTNDGTAAGVAVQLVEKLTLNHNNTGKTTLPGFNTFIGAVNLNAGTLAIGTDNALGNSSNPLTFNGATLETTGTLGMSRASTLNAGGGTFSTGVGTTLTHSGVITGSGRLTKAGGGTLILGNANNYEGGTSLDAGTLRLGVNGAVGSGSITASAGTTLSYGNNVTVGNSLSFSGGMSLEVQSGHSATQSGIINGTGGLSTIGTGILTLTNANTYTGGTTISEGQLVISADPQLGHASGGLTINSGSLRTTATMSSSRVITTGAASIHTDPGTTLTLNGSLTATGTFSKNGTGKMVLTNAATFTSFGVLGGTLEVQGAGASANASGNILVGITASTGGTLNILGGGSVTTATQISVGINNSGAGSLRISGVGSTLTANAAYIGVAGSGELTIENGGSLNSQTGSIARSSGGSGSASVTGNGSVWNVSSLNVGESGSGTLTVADHGIVRSTSTVALGRWGGTGTLNIGAGAAAGLLDAPGVEGTGTASLNFNHTDTDYFFTRNGTSGGAAIQITGTTAVASTNIGKTTLPSANTYTGGTTISFGTLSVSADNRLGDASGGLTLSHGGTLETTATMSTSRATTLGASGGGFRVSSGTTLTHNGVITGASLHKAGAGTLKLTNANTYTGGTNIRGGEVIVDDGSINHPTGSVAIATGSGEAATLEIVNGGTVTSFHGRLGANGGNGSATVSGAGSQWTMSQELTLGNNNSTGALNVEAGGRVQFGGGYIGNGANGSGAVSVTGGGSRFNNSGTLHVGYFGEGTLDITGGATSDLAGVTIGYGTDVTGTATVSGTGSQLSTGVLTLGHLGTGNLHITNGGSVTSLTPIIGSNGTGCVEVAGTGSEWKITSGALTVGGAGAGSLDIKNGAVVTNGYGSVGDIVGSTGTVNVSGGEWTNSDNLLIGNAGSGTVNLTGGKVTSDDTYLTSTAASSGTLNFGTGTTTGVLDTASIIGGNGTATVNFNHNQSNYYLTRNGLSNGVAVLIDGSTRVRQIGAGTTTLTGANTYAGGTVISGGTLKVTNHGSTLSSLGSGSVLVEAGGTLGGVGTVLGDTTVAGTLAPGNSPGTLHFAEDLFLADTAILQLEIASLFNFDQITVDGLLTYDGELSISLMDGYRPELGDVFTLFDAPLVSGSSTFDFISFNVSGYEGSFNNVSGEITIIAVPEPSSWALMLAAFLGTMTLPRRRG